MNATRVLIVDDHRLLVDGIRQALERDEDVDVVGVVSASEALLEEVRRTRPGVVLLDLDMHARKAFEALDLLRSHHPEVVVVVIALSGSNERVRAALARGAAGYIAKSVAPRDLPAVLRQAVAGSPFSGVAPEPSAPFLGGLTKRELVVLHGVARGLSNHAIAHEAWVTEQTVKFHLTNIFRKLSVRNRTEAALAALEQGLVDPNAPPAPQRIERVGSRDS